MLHIFASISSEDSPLKLHFRKFKMQKSQIIDGKGWDASAGGQYQSKSKAECNTFYLVGHFYRPPMNCHRRLGNVDLERWRLNDIALFGAKGNLWSSEGGAFLEGLTGVHGEAEGGKDDSMAIGRCCPEPRGSSSAGRRQRRSVAIRGWRLEEQQEEALTPAQEPPALRRCALPL